MGMLTKHCILEGTEAVLDVGCGDGRITKTIADWLTKGGYVVGMDLSENQIGHARKIHHLPNLCWQVKSYHFCFENK